MEQKKQMIQRMYSVSVGGGCNVFAIAFSKEHAIVEVVLNHISVGTLDFPTDYFVDDVREVLKKEMKNIIIDYNYVEDKTESDTLYNIFKKLTKVRTEETDFFGAVGDDYIDYL